jgi:hypothetical protein
MHTTTRRRLATFAIIIAAASAPWAPLFALHFYARTQPRTCEERRDVIIGGNRPASFGAVTTCYAWGWWEVSKSYRRDSE